MEAPNGHKFNPSMCFSAILISTFNQTVHYYARYNSPLI
jgi:hypothetical protein